MGICATKPSTDAPRAAKASGHEPPSHAPPAPPARPGRPSPTPPTPPARPGRPSPAGLGSLKDRYLAAAQQQARQRSSSEAVGPSISLRNLQAHTPANAKANAKAPPAAAAKTTTKGQSKAEAKAAKAAKAAATKAAKEAAKDAKKAAAVAAKTAKQAAKVDKKKTKKSTPEAGPAVPARTKAPPPVPVPSTARPPPRKAPPPRKTPPLRTKPGGATRAVSPPVATTAATTTTTSNPKAPSRFAPQQSPKCDACGKAVYMMERLGAITGGGNYHRACFRCSQCSAQLRPEGGWERMGAAGAAGAELVCCTKCSTQRKRAMTTEPVSQRAPPPVPKPWAPSAVQFNIPEQNSVRNIEINPSQRGNAGGGGGGGARGATASIGNSAGVVRPRGKSSILLQWVKEYLSNPIYAAKGVHVINWHTSWKDGLAFCALLHATNPSLIPTWDSLSSVAAEDNLNLAFRVAEKELGVTKLLDAEDIVEMRRPDAKSITTYVILLHKALSSAPE